jgi:hypothetical protein
MPYKQEGVGLWKQRALKLAQLTEDLIVEKQRLTAIYAALTKNPNVSLTSEVGLLRDWVLRDYHGTINEEKQRRLEDAILGRLRGNTTPELFRTAVNQQFSAGGIGLPFRTTQRISERLESALALGHAGSVSDALGMPAATSPEDTLSILKSQAELPPGENPSQPSKL